MNVVVVDWEKGAGHLMYYYSAANIRTVGAEIADVMDVLVEKGTTTYDNLWCVGFSLGAHACGQAGMRTERPIGRVTGEYVLLLNQRIVVKSKKHVPYKIL